MTDEDDDAFWQRLRATVARTDPLPDAVRQAGYAALSWGDPDAELITLVLDSADMPAAAVRDASTRIRLLTFGTEPFAIEVEVEPDGEYRVRLAGQLVPPGPARLGIEHGGGVLVVEADAVGRFSAAGVTRGPVRLRCDSPRVDTEWVLL